MHDVESEIKLCEQTLRRIESDREPLAAQLALLSEEENEIRLRICQLKYGISIGCIVERRGRQYRVTRIRPEFDPPWLLGAKKLKTGSWSTRDMNILGHWEVVKA